MWSAAGQTGINRELTVRRGLLIKSDGEHCSPDGGGSL